MNLILIKIGTNVLTQEDGRLDLPRIDHLVDQVAELKKQYKVVVVSSGAVGAGREMMPQLDSSRWQNRQVLAAVGQAKVMQIYANAFGRHGIKIAQVLATKEDFRDRKHYLNMRSCLRALLQDEVVPIVNENDVISIEELMFTDNDELGGLVSMMLGAERMLFLTSVDGFFNGNPSDDHTEVINEVYFENDNLEQHIHASKSSFGKGGMHTKYEMAKKLASIGIDSQFVNGKTDNIIMRAMAGERVGTHFHTSEKPVSSIKKWIFFYDTDSKGAVTITQPAEKIMKDENSTASLLLIGVESVEGEFEKGDIIAIKNGEGDLIGIGLSQWSSTEASENCLKKDLKPLIHYDYLYIY